MKVLITGANGFVGKNLKLFLKERSDIEIFSVRIFFISYLKISIISDAVKFSFVLDEFLV